MSGLFRSTVIKGNRLTDFASTGARVGTPLPFGYGEFVVEGNIIWAPLPPKETRKVRRQGKGGVKQETFTYTLSYAVGLARGPIYGIKWIKRNGKIVYTTDPNAPVEDAAFAAKWLEKATIYYGTKTQLPDSTIESYEGSGQVSAFRDLCYIVIEDEDVTQNGGAPASYQACLVANSDVYLTTPPYPIESVETFSEGMAVNGGTYRLGLIEKPVGFESFELHPDIVSGELRDPLKTIEIEPEAFAASVEITAGTLRAALVTYEHENTEAFVPSTELTGGTLRVALITAETLVETFDITTDIIGGTLT